MNQVNFRKFVRSLLAEPVASYWTDEEIDLYTDVAINNLQAELWYLLTAVHKKITALSPQDGFVELPDDCLKVLIVKPSDENSFDYIPEGLEESYAQNGWRGWTYQNGKIKIIGTPVPESLEVTYLPKFTFDTLPEILKPLVAVETVLQAKVKDDSIPQHIFLLREKFWRNVINFYAKTQNQNQETSTE